MRAGSIKSPRARGLCSPRDARARPGRRTTDGIACCDSAAIRTKTLTRNPCDSPAIPPRHLSNTFYPLAWRVIGAINAGLDDEMRFPVDDECALSKLEARFRARWGINSAFAYKGAVAALDGLIIKVMRPSKRSHHCPQAFFCGRYMCFGIAFQVLVGPDCEFLWSYGNAPGSVHDSVAFGMSRLYAMLRGGRMEARFHLVGDGAYCDESWLFTPFSEPRVGKLAADKDTFNWVHSSHRQCVERAFGARPASLPA